MCRDPGVSSDDMIEMVYVRSSRNRFISKVIYIYILGMMLYTVVPVVDVDQRLICLFNPRVLHGPPRYIYVGCGKYSLLTSHHVLGRILELYHAPQDLHGL